MQYNITIRAKDKGYQYIISYKDSNGTWKQKSKQGFKKSSQAKAEAQSKVKELEKEVNLKTPEEFQGITFGKFADEYLEHSKLYREYKTIESTKTTLKKFVDINDLELTKITTLDIQKIVDEMVKEGLKTNTIKYYLKKLTIIFNSAKNQYNIITEIPTRNIKTGKMNEISKRALTDDEVKLLLNQFKDTKYYLFIFIAINTGMRMGEILGLKWSDIDMKQHYIHVERQWKRLKDGSFNFGSLKSKNSKRIIPVSQAFCDELSKYQKVININSRVFDINYIPNFNSSLNYLLKAKGFEISIHELRHTYASKLIANGIDFKTAAQILGHDIQQTIKTYSHVNNDMLSNAKNLIENIF